MQEQTTPQDLRDRLCLIESMIAEGRRTTESWGWVFVLWGAAYMIALAWTNWGHSGWAWLVTMVAATIVTGVVISAKAGGQPQTTMGRAVLSIWMALGISMFVLFPALALSGRLIDPHIFVATVSSILGMANGASGLILRWKIQLLCAVVWWGTAVAACFTSDTSTTIEFLVAIFLCQIVFGVYCMIARSGARKQSGTAHA